MKEREPPVTPLPQQIHLGISPPATSLRGRMAAEGTYYVRQSGRTPLHQRSELQLRR